MKANNEMSKKNKKIIYAITFKLKESPFPEIDKYVCVPCSWIIHRLDARKILVAYPKNEAPFVTRNRVKKREKADEDWRFYLGYIEFQSENYDEVVQWIENMIEKGGDIQENEQEMQDPLAEPVGSRQLRSEKNPVLSGILPEKPQLVVKPYDNPRRPLPKMLIGRPLPLRPWKPKQIQSSKPAVSFANVPSKNQSVTVEHHNIQNKQNSVDTSAQSLPKLPDDRQPSPRPADGRQPSTKPADGREPSPKPADGRQSSPKPADGRQPSPVQYEQPYDNPRRPLPKMLIRRPLPLRPWKPKPIQSSKPAVSFANVPSKNQSVTVEHHNIQNKQNSVDTSAQSLPKLPDDRQPSPRPADGRQPSTKPADGREPSPKPADGRQSSPKPADGRQPSPVQYEQPPDFDDSNVEIVIEVRSAPTEEKRPPSSEQTQPDSVLEHHFSLIESRLNEIHNGPQANDSLKTLLVQNSAARPPSRALPHDYAQSVSAPSSKPQLQGTIGTSSKPIHSYEITHLRGLVKTVSSTTHNTPTAIGLSSQRQIPAIRRKSTTAINKPAGKKARIESITNNIPTSQQSLYNKQPPNYHGNVGDQRHLQSVNTSAAQSLSHLAQTRFYEPSQLQYLQQIAQMQDMINRSNMPYFDQRNYVPYQNTLPGYVPRQPNQINPNQYLPHQNQQPMVSTNQMSELMRYVTTPSVAAPQRQDPPSYQDPRTVKPIESQRNPRPQVAKRPVASTAIHQQVSNDQRNNPRKDLLVKLSVSPVKCIDICADPATCPDSETQSKVPEKIVYQHPESKKLVADQATEMESNKNQDSGTQSSTAGTAELKIESGYETDKHPTNEQESQEVPDSEMVYDDTEISDNVSTNGSDCANEDYNEEDTMASITDETSMDVQNLVPNIQEKPSEIADKEMMEVYGLLLTKLYKTFINTEEYCNNLRIATLGHLKLYETLLNKTKKLTVVESHTNLTSKAPEVPRVQETPVPAPAPISVPVPVSAPVSVRAPAPVPMLVLTPVSVPVPKPAPEPEQNPTSEQNYNCSVKNSPKKSKRRHTFALPPEYDPTDSRWTLKHRERGPKLMELMPRSRVYVSIDEYNKCIRSSNDCRTLARSLLTAVFSRNALSVCSPTGAKARAFNNVNIDTRPGLDEDSRLALLAFVDKYGKERKWNTSDAAGIMSSIRTKIQDMRQKYGKTKVV